MTLLKELDAQERGVIQQAVVVVRRNDGQVVDADRTESSSCSAPPAEVSSGC